MTNEQIGKILTEGLLQGYAGDKQIEEVRRGNVFRGKASHVVFGEETAYHDEWFASSQGGGQELVQAGDKTFTRLYAGGSPKESVLRLYGITTDDVGKYLKQSIVKLGDQTRLFEDCLPEADGDWRYSYNITQRFHFASLTVGKEMIHYKTHPVHVHLFLLTPVK